MRILLSNDDGCTAPGLLALAKRLREKHAVDIVAPDRNRSGASNSLTILNPIRVQKHEDGPYKDTYCVDGTPTDCVHLALTGLLETPPDVVVSGINNGPNLGDDTLYSGTVAAAMEGRTLGCSAVAVSCASVTPQHYDTAARVTARILDRLDLDRLPGDTILNVNVPDLPYEALAGYEVTRLGNRHRSETAMNVKDPRGRPIWWIGAAGAESDSGPGTDFHAIAHGRVSITPLLVDFTKFSVMERVAAWVEAL